MISFGELILALIRNDRRGFPVALNWATLSRPGSDAVNVVDTRLVGRDITDTCPQEYQFPQRASNVEYATGGGVVLRCLPVNVVPKSMPRIIFSRSRLEPKELSADMIARRENERYERIQRQHANRHKR